MDALKVNKFGRTYRTGTQAAQVIVVGSYYFLNPYENVQLAKRDIKYRRHLLLHNDRDDSRLLA